jgi:mannose-6-phosphate isomerase-like protein (cupin superfamily)
MAKTARSHGRRKLPTPGQAKGRLKSAKRTTKKRATKKSATNKPAKKNSKTLATVALPAALPRRKTAVRPESGKKARRPARAPQTFLASHLHMTSFDEGLRSYAQYRDLGVKNASGGLVQAHVIRFLPPCRPEEVSKLHYHDVEFQMIYVLKGWIRSEFAGEGAHTFEAGSCWVQPPRIEHKILDYSDDCEVLEIIMPAEFETVTLD